MYDFCRTDDAPVLNNEVDLIIQQIEILFDTNKGEVLGNNRYGTNYGNFLHELTIGESTVKDIIYNDITNNVELFDWDLEVDVKFMLGDQSDIMIVGIQFSKDSERYSRVYRVSEYVDDYSEYVIPV